MITLSVITFGGFHCSCFLPYAFFSSFEWFGLPSKVWIIFIAFNNPFNIPQKLYVCYCLLQKRLVAFMSFYISLSLVCVCIYVFYLNHTCQLSLKE
jgi:hypothetical protein